MNKRMIMILAASIALLFAVSGATYALFTSQASNNGNTFTAGRLQIRSYRDNMDRIPGPMFYTTADEGATTTVPSQPGLRPTGKWAPGDVWERTLIVENDPGNTGYSTLDAYLERVYAVPASDSTPSLAEKLRVQILTPDPLNPSTQTVVAEGLMTDFYGTGKQLRFADGSRVLLLHPGTQPLTFRVNFDINANNDYQGKSLVVDFYVAAEQVRNNP